MKETIEPQDQADHDLGLEIVRVLQLRRKHDNGRIETTHGDKNPCGLTRTLRDLSASRLEKAAPEMLAALERLLALSKSQEFGSQGVRLDLIGDTARAAIYKAKGEA
jgi:hypothetical protein